MNKKIQIVAIVGAVAFSALVLSSPSDPIPLPDTFVTSTITDTKNASISIIAENLDKPRAIAVATSENKIFVTEQGGTIRVIENGTMQDAPLAVFRGTPTVFDGGLLGITTHPDFEQNHYIYVFLTYVTTPEDKFQNKIIRITESNNRIQEAHTILDDIPGSQFTNGGFLKFGPDGKLYTGTGTPYDASHLPQDLDSLAGKILRINPDGTIPDDNPFPDSLVYSLGHRNPQGITWDDTGRMYVAEQGPEKNDEINIITPGTNYGWPDRQCTPDINGQGGAILCYDPSIDPGGIIHYTSERLSLEKPFVMTSLRASNLYQLDFEEGLPSQKPILSGVGRIRDVVQAPDGSLYVITSNTDGKGFPEDTDDRLLRIIK